MSGLKRYQPDPKLDLVLERVIDVPKELVWRAWTEPELIKKWFTPVPWQTVDCEIDLRPGGLFRTVMRSPEGQEFPNTGCFLEIVPHERLAWTNSLEPGFRPANIDSPELAACGKFPLTAVITLETQGKGTRYTAIAMHKDEAGRNQHAAMGFEAGWGKALDQLVAHVKTL